MTQYVIATQDPDDDEFSTGIVLSIEEAINPEDAMLQWAKKAVDDEFLDMAKKEDLTPKSQVMLARWIIDGKADDVPNFDVIIYPVQTDPQGTPINIHEDELEYEDPV